MTDSRLHWSEILAVLVNWLLWLLCYPLLYAGWLVALAVVGCAAVVFGCCATVLVSPVWLVARARSYWQELCKGYYL